MVHNLPRKQVHCGSGDGSIPLFSTKFQEVHAHVAERHTRTVEVRIPKGLRVQVPSRAPEYEMKRICSASKVVMHWIANPVSSVRFRGGAPSLTTVSYQLS